MSRPMPLTLSTCALCPVTLDSTPSPQEIRLLLQLEEEVGEACLEEAQSAAGGGSSPGWAEGAGTSGSSPGGCLGGGSGGLGLDRMVSQDDLMEALMGALLEVRTPYV